MNLITYKPPGAVVRLRVPGDPFELLSWLNKRAGATEEVLRESRARADEILRRQA